MDEGWEFSVNVEDDCVVGVLFKKVHILLFKDALKGALMNFVVADMF